MHVSIFNHDNMIMKLETDSRCMEANYWFQENGDLPVDVAELRKKKNK